MPVIVGGVVEKDGKYLLVQEAKAKCYGKWNLPAGHLDSGETLFEGAVREVKEETNCEVELTGICQIANQIRVDDIWLGIVFVTKILEDDQLRPQEGEILDVQWFSYDEIIAMRDQLRAPEWIISALDATRRGKIMPLDLINILTKKEIR